MTVDVLPGPQLETHERPDAFRVIAGALFVLLQERADFAGIRPAALRRVRVEQDVARPADHLLVEPAAQRDAEPALRTRQHRVGHPRANHIPEQPLRGLRIAVARRRLRRRQLDDAILSLRTNEPELGLWILKTAGNPDALVALDGFLVINQSDWFIREVLGILRRTFVRLDVSSRSMYAIVTPESCFAGTLLELALAADRVYMLDADAGTAQATMTLSAMNFGPLPMATGHSRLAMRFYHDREALDRLEARVGVRLTTRDADALGLVTAAPDILDWDDELRQAVETRTALSGDALSGLEANLRFALPETQDTRVFGRLSAWQNWIFVRPNAVGPSGALKVYGTGAAVGFDRERV